MSESSITLTDGFHNRLNSIEEPPVIWSVPQRVDIGSWADRREVSRKIDRGEITVSNDRVSDFADTIFEVKHPGLVDDDNARQEFVDNICAEPDYGEHFILPWRKSITRYPSKDDLRSARTFRNREVLTEEEQKRLFEKRIAVFGLSVGSWVVSQLVRGGVGGEYELGDFDTLSLSNLNRFDGGVHEVGSKKLDIVGCRTSELDPYLTQYHHTEGVNPDVLARLEERKPDIIFDEVDQLAVKVLMREYARKNRVPLVMVTDVGEKSLLDVERYDIDPSTLPFLGRADIDPEEVVSPNFDEKRKTDLMIKLVGVKNVSPRLLRSAMNKGKTTTGLPQIGSIAALGGARASIAAREILLGNNNLQSGRYSFDTRKDIGAGRHDSLTESAQAIIDFVKDRKNNKN